MPLSIAGASKDITYRAYGKLVPGAITAGRAIPFTALEARVQTGCAKLGEIRRAVDTLRLAIDAGVRNFGWMKADPDLDSLRGDPEFIVLTEPR